MKGKEKLLIIEIIVIFFIIISIIYSITRVKVIILNEKYTMKKGDSIITPVGGLEIIDINKDEVVVNIAEDVGTYKYNKAYTVHQRIPPSTDTNGNTMTSIALKVDMTLKKCNIYIPVTIAGILIILTCSIIKKTKKPKGEI